MSDNEERNDVKTFGLILQEASILIDALSNDHTPEELAEELEIYALAWDMVHPLSHCLDNRKKCLAALKLAESAIYSGESFWDMFRVERVAHDVLQILTDQNLNVESKGRMEASRDAAVLVQGWITGGHTGFKVHFTPVIPQNGMQDSYRQAFTPVVDRTKRGNRNASLIDGAAVLAVARESVRQMNFANPKIYGPAGAVQKAKV
jgi:hypothetical protein